MIAHNILPYYRKIRQILIMTPDLALLSTLIGSNYHCLELILRVPKGFEPLNFDFKYRRENVLIPSRGAVPPRDAVPQRDVIGSSERNE